MAEPRRTSPIAAAGSIGLERLRQSVLRQGGDLATSVDGVLDELGQGGVADDTAVLAIRWAR